MDVQKVQVLYVVFIYIIPDVTSYVEVYANARVYSDTRVSSNSVKLCTRVAVSSDVQLFKQLTPPVFL